ncbi:MAG: hypothetical protein V1936_00845, partial [Patescibacteria group bacterium]
VAQKTARLSPSLARCLRSFTKKSDVHCVHRIFLRSLANNAIDLRRMAGAVFIFILNRIFADGG